MDYIVVEYVGPKPQEIDNVANTGKVWIGKGDRHEVPASAWEIMKRHPDVFALVGPAPKRGLAQADNAEVLSLKAENEALKAENAELREKVKALTPAPGKPDDWLTLDVEQLHAYATERSLKIDKRLKDADRIRAAIEAAQPAG